MNASDADPNDLLELRDKEDIFDFNATGGSESSFAHVSFVLNILIVDAVYKILTRVTSVYNMLCTM